MRKFWWISLPVALASFVGGLFWAQWSVTLRKQRIAHAAPLRVLCGENWLSTAALEKFSSENGVRIEQYTYAHPSDFLRQMANADGKVDVVCTSSLLVRGLVRSHWLKTMDFSNLSNLKRVSVDFLHLPYDPQAEYTVPLFWNLYGFFGKGELPHATWRQAWQSKKLSLWGDELNVLHLMTSLDLNASERLVADQKTESISLAFKKFMKSGVRFFKPQPMPVSADAALGKAEWIELPLSRVAGLLGKDSPYRFWLPEDGATIEVGLLAVGEKSTQPELALALINALLDDEAALATHAQMGAGVVHRSLAGQTSITALQKPEALRLFPLNRLSFPDVDEQDVPHFQKVFDEASD